MQEGFYWVQHNTDEPEVWFFSDEKTGAWFEPTKNESMTPQRFTELGYHIVSERLTLS